MVSTPPSEKPRPVHPIFQTFWYLGCILTLGFAPKYLRRIEEWELYDSPIYDEQYGAYSISSGVKRFGLVPSEQRKQEKEWDRLMIPLAIMTATSVTALAISSPLNLHWLSAAFYAAAFGLSLEGLLLTTYLTIFGSSTETIDRVEDKSFPKRAVGPAAIIIALPIALVTYTTLFLLGGLAIMAGAAEGNSNIEEHRIAFRVIVLAPLSTVLVCLLMATIGWKVFDWMEAKRAQVGDAEDLGTEGLPLSVDRASVGKC